MAFQLEDLPYDHDALEPAISPRTLEYHHGKHHKGYIDKLNKAIDDTPYADRSLTEIIRSAHEAGDTGVFRNAAQAWNHDFLWNSMSPDGGGDPGGSIADLIESSYGDFSSFREKFRAAATSQFGSGWVWLMHDGDSIDIVTTGNADTPIMNQRQPLLTLDVWEHAYYLDYQNDRAAYIDAFLDELVNWKFAKANLVAKREAA
jgi:Fe-Mn family superoxide dismutase